MDVYNVTNASGETLSKWDVNIMLEDLGISDEAIEEGTEDAIEADAEKNHIDLTQLTDMAKAQGDNDVSGSADTAKTDYDNQLKALGVPADVVSKGPAAVQAYAEKNGINLPPSNGTTLNFKS